MKALLQEAELAASGRRSTPRKMQTPVRRERPVTPKPRRGREQGRQGVVLTPRCQVPFSQSTEESPGVLMRSYMKMVREWANSRGLSLPRSKAKGGKPMLSPPAEVLEPRLRRSKGGREGYVGDEWVWRFNYFPFCCGPGGGPFADNAPYPEGWEVWLTGNLPP